MGNAQFSTDTYLNKYLSVCLLFSLRYLHSHGVFHRDIKCANVLVNQSGVVKILDFGCSIQLRPSGDDERLHAFAGTPSFMAPEMLTEQGSCAASDIWSLGCTVLQMATGLPPWHWKGFTSVIELVGFAATQGRQGVSPIPPELKKGKGVDGTTLTPRLIDFLEGMFMWEKTDRVLTTPTEKQPVPIMDHPFLSQCDFANAEHEHDLALKQSDPLISEFVEKVTIDVGRHMEKWSVCVRACMYVLCVVNVLVA